MEYIDITKKKDYKMFLFDTNIGDLEVSARDMDDSFVQLYETFKEHIKLMLENKDNLVIHSVTEK